jgi:hypothetical protein
MSQSDSPFFNPIFFDTMGEMDVAFLGVDILLSGVMRVFLNLRGVYFPITQNSQIYSSMQLSSPCNPVFLS